MVVYFVREIRDESLMWYPLSKLSAVREGCNEIPAIDSSLIIEQPDSEISSMTFISRDCVSGRNLNIYLER